MTASDSHHFDFGVRRKGPHCPLLWNKFINPHPPNTHSSLKVQAPIQSATSACESSILTDLSHPLPRSKRSSSLSESPLCKVLVLHPDRHHDPHKAKSSTPAVASHILPSPAHNSHQPHPNPRQPTLLLWQVSYQRTTFNSGTSESRRTPSSSLLNSFVPN